MTARYTLVTGAASGIGAASHQLLSRNGYDDARTRRHSERWSPSLRRDSPAEWTRIACHIGENFGGLDIAHLNAGVASRQKFITELTDQVYRHTLAVNLDGVVFGVRALVPLMRPGGAIVVTCSVAGMRPGPLDPVYTVTKHGVIGLVRSIAADLTRRGLTINAICPGFVDTPLSRGMQSSPPSSKVHTLCFWHLPKWRKRRLTLH